ncbi:METALLOENDOPEPTIDASE OMA1 MITOCHONDRIAL [Salix viminalis]|uniref:METALLOENDOPEPTIDASE OMA1 MITOCHONDRIAL n=1 Tax=Salix viminalis TaxID=40686 RepID=A0A9Q0SGH2_SALVM|nr:METALLOENDOPEPTIDASE OMA1 MITOCHONDRIAL [Salix viminalis]
MKKDFKEKILPGLHHESVRVRLITQDVIEALQRGLKREHVWSDMGYASPERSGMLWLDMQQKESQNFWVAFSQLILFQFIMPVIAHAIPLLFLRLPFSRRMEIESDFIGLLLVASAGYDLRITP